MITIHGRCAMGPAGRAGDIPVHFGDGCGRGVGGVGAGARTLSPVQVTGYRRHQQDEGLRMLKLLWLVPAIPFAGALVLTVLGARMPHKHVTVVGVGTVAASAFISILIATVFLSAPPASGMYTQTLWTWIDVGSFSPQIAFYLDALSLVMILVVTFVSFLIHLYSAEFMRTDEGYRDRKSTRLNSSHLVISYA